MADSKYDELDPMREYTEIGNLKQSLNDKEHNSEESDIDIVENGNGQRVKTANDGKQWVFVVKKTIHNNLFGERQENQPLLLQSATDALNALHGAQTRNTLEMDIRRTDLHMSQAILPQTFRSPIPNVDFLYVGISEKRMRYWCDKLEYQLQMEPNVLVEWLLLIDNQLVGSLYFPQFTVTD